MRVCVCVCVCVCVRVCVCVCAACGREAAGATGELHAAAVLPGSTVRPAAGLYHSLLWAAGCLPRCALQLALWDPGESRCEFSSYGLSDLLIETHDWLKVNGQCACSAVGSVEIISYAVLLWLWIRVWVLCCCHFLCLVADSCQYAMWLLVFGYSVNTHSYTCMHMHTHNTHVQRGECVCVCMCKRV